MECRIGRKLFGRLNGLSVCMVFDLYVIMYVVYWMSIEN